MERLTSQVDGPITGRCFIRVGGGAYHRKIFFCLQVDGPITGGGFISGEGGTYNPGLYGIYIRTLMEVAIN